MTRVANTDLEKVSAVARGSMRFGVSGRWPMTGTGERAETGHRRVKSGF